MHLGGGEGGGGGDGRLGAGVLVGRVEVDQEECPDEAVHGEVGGEGERVREGGEGQECCHPPSQHRQHHRHSLTHLPTPPNTSGTNICCNLAT